jgi:hypothetical protein
MIPSILEIDELLYLGKGIMGPDPRSLSLGNGVFYKGCIVFT